MVMSRLIFYLVILGIIYWVVKQALSPPREKTPKPRATKDTGEELVQDPLCKCYIPKSQAYYISLKGEKLYFCSEECYKKYLADPKKTDS